MTKVTLMRRKNLHLRLGPRLQSIQKVVKLQRKYHRRESQSVAAWQPRLAVMVTCSPRLWSVQEIPQQQNKPHWLCSPEVKKATRAQEGSSDWYSLLRFVCLLTFVDV